MKCVLIRHGKTAGNLAGRYIGCRTDEPLCPEGIAQLREGRYPAVERVFASPLRRCRETARLLYPAMEMEIVEDFRECDFGAFEGLSYADLNGRADYAAWLTGDWFGNVPPGGESFAQAQARILAGLARMQAQGEDILAVVHGGTVLTIMQALFPEEEKNGYEWQPRPGGGYRLDLEAHTWTPIGIQP